MAKKPTKPSAFAFSAPKGKPTPPKGKPPCKGKGGC